MKLPKSQQSVGKEKNESWSQQTWRVCLWCWFTCVGWVRLAGCWAYKTQENWSLLLYSIAYWIILYIFIEERKKGGKDTRKILFLMLLKECTLDREKRYTKIALRSGGNFVAMHQVFYSFSSFKTETVEANAYREIKLSLIRICLKLYNNFVI